MENYKTTSLEIERKWLFDFHNNMNNASLLKLFGEHHKIWQTYIDDVRYRIKISECHKLGVSSHVAEKTIKSGSGLIREETNYDITTQEVMDVVSQFDAKWMTKTRYVIPCGKYKVELDLYHHDNIVFMSTVEVEFESEEDAYEFDKHIPWWFGDEVTGIEEYTSRSIHAKFYANGYGCNVSPVS